MKKNFTILGGGIAGLTAAIALKKIGIEAKVYEGAPEFKPVGAGIVLAANALRAYQHIDLYNNLKNSGHSISEMSIKDHKGKVITKTSTKGLKNSLDNLAILRADLHDILLSQINDSQITTGKRSKDLEYIDNKYKVLFDDNTLLETDYLIVAEGIHSPIRSQVFPEGKIRYSGYTCWRGLTDNNLNIKEPSETWGSKGRFGLVPIGNNQIYWFACKNAEKDSVLMKAFTVDDLHENFKDYHFPISEVIKNTPVDQLIWNDIIDLKPIPQYAFGNLVLIGDAAHATTPNMGQGACMAIEDAVILAECLKDKSSVKDAFLDFEKKRIKRTHHIVNQSWKTGQIAQLENKFIAKIRNMAFRAIPSRIMDKQIEKIYNISFS